MDEDVAAVRDTWDAVADAWESHRDALGQFTRPVFDAIVAELDPGPDDRILELACGTGALGRALAARAHEVVQTDISPRMAEAARLRADADRRGNILVEVADAHDLAYEDGSFDGIACQMAFMLMPRPVDAMRECRRVLRRPGRLVFATWGPAERNPWIIAIGAALLQHGSPVPGDPTGPGGLFSLSDGDTIAEAASAAGFDDVRTTAVAVAEAFATFDEYWDQHVRTGGPLRTVVDGLDAERLAAVRGTCRDFCAAFRTADGYEFPGEALVTVAR